MEIVRMTEAQELAQKDQRFCEATKRQTARVKIRTASEAADGRTRGRRGW